jgi:hypothetical protein
MLPLAFGLSGCGTSFDQDASGNDALLGQRQKTPGMSM